MSSRSTLPGKGHVSETKMCDQQSAKSSSPANNANIPGTEQEVAPGTLAADSKVAVVENTIVDLNNVRRRALHKPVQHLHLPLGPLEHLHLQLAPSTAWPLPTPSTSRSNGCRILVLQDRKKDLIRSSNRSSRLCIQICPIDSSADRRRKTPLNVADATST